MDRRDFLRDAAIGAVLLPRLVRADAPKVDVPIVIATWDYGIELCAAAQQVFAKGGDILDALERGVNVVEDDPAVHSVGYNGMPNAEGVTQLDAAIMDGRTHKAGAVAALERIKNAVSVARKVMEKTPHVLLAGAGALEFATKSGFKEQDLLAPDVRKEWEKTRQTSDRHDTVACIGLDANGNLATAVSTSGLADKLPGRVGDSPLIGAGSYCDNDVGGAAATGVGELAIRNVASFAIVERMRAGVDPTRACNEILDRIRKKVPEMDRDPKAQLAFIAMNKAGEVGAAVLRPQKHPFRYALMRGTKTPPTLHDVTPSLAP